MQVTGEMTDELRAEMLAVPSSDTVAQLQHYIEAKQAEAESIVCGNNRVVEEHKFVLEPSCQSCHIHIADQLQQDHVCFCILLQSATWEKVGDVLAAGCIL